MNNILGENIARLRKEKGMTQEDLARELNISYQAVSKWENGVSSPDISNIKLLAQFFGVSIDMLFGMELIPTEREEQKSAMGEGEIPAKEENVWEENSEAYLPWEDDQTLRAVLFRGRTLLSAQEVCKGGLANGVRLEYSGEPMDVFSYFDVSCGEVRGSVAAQGDVSCGDVGQTVGCGGDVSCGDVGGNVSAGGDVSCGDVGGSVNTGGDVDCGDVGGDIRTGGDVDCGTVIGSVVAYGDVDCGKVGGSVAASVKPSREASRGVVFSAESIGDMVDDILRQTKESIASAFSDVKKRGERE